MSDVNENVKVVENVEVQAEEAVKAANTEKVSVFKKIGTFYNDHKDGVKKVLGGICTAGLAVAAYALGASSNKSEGDEIAYYVMDAEEAEESTEEE